MTSPIGPIAILADPTSPIGARDRADYPSGQTIALRMHASRRRAPRVLGPSTFVRRILLGMNVFALPNVPREIAEDSGEVMVAAATGGGAFPQHAAADDATESLAVGLAPDRGAAPKRGAVIFDQTI